MSARWLVMRSVAGSGATNMATDAALLAHARRSGAAILRTYTWSRPTLSLGRHERARGLYDGARLAALGADVVRRPTGGRALLHHRELTYSVAAPVGTATLAESYAAINALLRAALARLGVTVEDAAPTARTPRPEGGACFATPATGELTWRGRKLVGSAQLREEGAFLQHGSILLGDDQPMIAALRTGGAGEAPAPLPAATLTEALGRPVAATEVAEALVGALAASLTTGGEAPAELPSLDPASLHGDLARLEDAFRSPEWTWRR